MQNKDKGDGIEDSPLDMLLVILLEGASKEVVTPSSQWQSVEKEGNMNKKQKKKDEQYENEKKNTRYGRKPYSNQHKWWTMAWVDLDTIMVELCGWRWIRKLHGRVWKVKDEGCSHNWREMWVMNSILEKMEVGG